MSTIASLHRQGFDHAAIDRSCVPNKIIARCSQCNVAIINGVPAHETGCPNIGKPVSVGSWRDKRPGDTVRFLVYAGLGRNGPEFRPTGKGRVVIKTNTHLVVNAGGPHGTPKIVDDKNFLS